MTIHSCRTCHHSWTQLSNGTWLRDVTNTPVCEHPKILLVPYVP